MFCRKHWLVFILGFMFWMGCCMPAKADVVDIKAESAILIDANSGRVLYAREADKRLPPASMTKLMTLVLGVDALDSGRVQPGEKVIASENAWKLGGSQIYLEPGEEMTFRDLLISVAVGSANDACVAVAEHLEGSHEAFVQKMNKTAREIGMKHTHFANAYGLPDPNHYTTAEDMSKLALYALRHPRVLEFTSIKEYSLRDGEFKLFNTNKLLWWYKGTDGFKTGWTNEAKFCLVSTVKRNHLRLAAVVLGSPEARGNFRDSMAMYNYGFARYAFRSFGNCGDVCGLVRVGKGTGEAVEAVASRDIGSICIKGKENQITCQTELKSYMNAPLKKGQVLGWAKVYQDDSLVQKVALIASRDVQKRSLWETALRMWNKTFMI